MGNWRWEVKLRKWRWAVEVLKKSGKTVLKCIGENSEKEVGMKVGRALGRILRRT